MPAIESVRLSNKKLNDWLVELRDSAFAHAKPFHESIKWEQIIYADDAPHDRDTHMGSYAPVLRGKSLFPKLPEAIQQILPRLDQSTPRARFFPDKTALEKTPIVADYVEDMNRWLEMYEEVDNEGQKTHIANLHVLVGGMAIRKVRWDTITNRLNCPVISPLSFAVHDKTTEIDLSDCDYVCQTDTITPEYAKRFYNYRPPSADMKSLRLDEIWIRKEFAEEHVTSDRMICAVLVENQLVKIRKSPWAYPDFPYACWRNIPIYDDSGKPNQFWGYGFARFLWRQQKVIDEIMANLLLIASNSASGRSISNANAIDIDSMDPRHGLHMVMNEGHDISEYLELNPPQTPQVYFDLLTMMVNTIEGITGASEVFSGEAPFSGVSGRAVAALQAAAFTMISDLLRGMIDFRSKLGRIKGVFIQQNAQVPVNPNLWRGGVDIQEEFPKGAKDIGFRVEVHDVSSLPQNPAAKLEVATALFDRGLIGPEKFLELSGFDKSYGITPEDLQQVPTVLPGANGEVNQEVLSGQEPETGVTV